MYQCGISHGDLNTNNIIIGCDSPEESGVDQDRVPDGSSFVIVDFERSRDDEAFGPELRITTQ